MIFEKIERFAFFHFDFSQKSTQLNNSGVNVHFVIQLSFFHAEPVYLEFINKQEESCKCLYPGLSGRKVTKE